MTNDAVLNIRIPKSVLEALKKNQRATGCTPAEYARRAIEQSLELKAKP